MKPIQQLLENAKHYELSGRSFREDADRYHKKAEDAFRLAEEYRQAAAKLGAE